MPQLELPPGGESGEARSVMYKCYLFDEQDSVLDIWPIQCENDREAEESALDIQAACSAATTEVWRAGRLVFRSSPPSGRGPLSRPD